MFDNSDLFIFLLYKLFSMLAGVLSIYWGYRLFTKGLFTSAGDLETQFGNKKILLRKAAPGTFFSLFGAVIIGISVFKGLKQSDAYQNPEATFILPEKISEVIEGVEQIDSPPSVNIDTSIQKTKVQKPLSKNGNTKNITISVSTKQNQIDSLYELLRKNLKAKNYSQAVENCNMLKGIAIVNKNFKIDTAILNKIVITVQINRFKELAGMHY